MAGTLNVDTLKADSNLRLQIASANVAFIDANGLTIVGNSLNVGGGRIVVTSNNSISTPSIIGANLVTATGTTALGIAANGQITTANAPFILTGGQIKFPSTKIPSADANTLDDYEEGTWTGTIKGLTTDPTTPVTATGSYTKIGRQVFARITYSAITTTGASGDFYISGLPFTAGDSEATGNVMTYSLATFAGSNLCPYVTGTSIFLYHMSSNGIWAAATHNAGTNRYLIVSVTYQV